MPIGLFPIYLFISDTSGELYVRISFACTGGGFLVVGLRAW